MVRHRATGKYRRVRLFLLTLTLAHSRKSVRLLTWKSSLRIWAELHEQAFRRLGGVTAQVAAAFADERPHLKPLPIEPFRYYAFGTRTAHLNGFAEVGGAYYAPPDSGGRSTGRSGEVLDPAPSSTTFLRRCCSSNGYAKGTGIAPRSAKRRAADRSRLRHFPAGGTLNNRPARSASDREKA